MNNTIYTIGHSTHRIEQFIALLQRHSIQVVCDVRSRPYSGTNPQFNLEPLRNSLKTGGMKYVFLGAELGARSDDEHCYVGDQVQYDLLSETLLFRKGLDRVKEGSISYRIALMCAEREPLECHRSILVARHLVEGGFPVVHILADGRLEPHERAMDRLVSQLELTSADMFRSDEAIVDEAYATRGHAIAYRRLSGTGRRRGGDRRGAHGAARLP